MVMKTCPSGHALGAMALATGVITLLAAGPAQAHQVGLSRGVYTVDGAEVTARLTFAGKELLSLLPGLDYDVEGARDGALDNAELAAGLPLLQSRVVAAVELVADGQPCVGAITRARLTEADGAQLLASYTCPAAPQSLTLRLPLLDALGGGHRHLAQVERAGVPEADLVLHARAPEATVVLHARAPEATVSLHARAPEATASLQATPGAAEAPARPFGAYFMLGLEHILLGVDHLVFLLGLVVLGGRLRSLIAVVTAFTIGHSLSLALATLGVWTPGPQWVEPAIALSIAYIGLENFVVPDAAGRWRITLPFGFIHGFGFAGVLSEFGVPADAVGPALLLFNLGVEAGQLLVLAFVLPLLLWLGRREWYRSIRGARWISASIVAAGLYWFLERTVLAT